MKLGCCKVPLNVLLHEHMSTEITCSGIKHVAEALRNKGLPLANKENKSGTLKEVEIRYIVIGGNTDWC